MRAIRLLLFLAVATSSLIALADDTDTARVRFHEGVALFDKGEFDKARAAFLQAWALRKHPSILLNLAQSCLKGKRHGEAARYFQQFLDAQGVTPEQRETAEKGLVEARTSDARLGIEAPVGAEVSVDDERIGVAPLTAPVDVEPGTHVVRAKLGTSVLEQRATVAVTQTATVKLGASGQTAPVTPTATATGALAVPPPTLNATDDSLLGGPGESCRARVDCKANLRCVEKTCVDEHQGQTCAATSDCGGNLKCIRQECTSELLWKSGEPAPEKATDFHGTHAFVGLAVRAGPAWEMVTTSAKVTTDASLQGSFLAALKLGLMFDRDELAIEVSPFTYLPYSSASGVFTGAAFQATLTYGHYYALHEGHDVSVYWPIRVGAGVLAGDNSTLGLVYFQARLDLIGVAVRLGHVMIGLDLPSFRYAITNSVGTTLHLFSWHAGASVSYLF